MCALRNITIKSSAAVHTINCSIPYSAYTNQTSMPVRLFSHFLSCMFMIDIISTSYSAPHTRILQVHETHNTAQVCACVRSRRRRGGIAQHINLIGINHRHTKPPHHWTFLHDFPCAVSCMYVCMYIPN